VYLSHQVLGWGASVCGLLVTVLKGIPLLGTVCLYFATGYGPNSFPVAAAHLAAAISPTSSRNGSRVRRRWSHRNWSHKCLSRIRRSGRSIYRSGIGSCRGSCNRSS
jgi:hypothetical protein